jgi:hypothetical protein
MTFFNFPGHFVYWTPMKKHEEMKNDIVSSIVNIKKTQTLENPFKQCSMETNFNKDDIFLKHEHIHSIVHDTIKTMINESDNNFIKTLNPTKIKVFDYWFNFYKKGDFQEYHKHSNNGKHLINYINNKRYDLIFSLVYILHDKSPCDSLVFNLDDDNVPFTPNNCSVGIKTSDFTSIKEGTVIVFSSLLSHKVEKIKVPGRITLAFNIGYNFQ